MIVPNISYSLISGVVILLLAPPVTMAEQAPDFSGWKLGRPSERDCTSVCDRVAPNSCNANAMTAVDTENEIRDVAFILGRKCSRFTVDDIDFNPAIDDGTCFYNTNVASNCRSVAGQSFGSGERVCCCAETSKCATVLPPTNAPSVAPSVVPSVAPSVLPSVVPSMAPSSLPSSVPSSVPTLQNNGPKIFLGITVILGILAVLGVVASALACHLF